MDRLCKVDLPSDLSSIQSAFQSVIMSARTNFPDIESFSPTPWWNPSLSTLFRKYQAARKKMSKYANPANYIEYMKILKEWRSAVGKAKRAHRAIAIKELCGNGNPCSFWNYINGHRHSSRKLSGCAVWNDRDNKKYLDMLKSYIPIVNPITMPSIPFSSISNTPFSLHELMYVLHSRKRATAAGCDGVKYDMLTALSGGSFSMLLHAINNCWSTNFILSDLRCIKIVPIPKPGKDLNDLRSFRPISLISVFIKTINLMVKERLTAFLKTENIIPARSYAYQKRKSTNMCVNELCFLIVSLKKAGKKVVMFPLDISKAYDCVNLIKLGRILLNFSIPLQMRLWILNFLSKRVLVMGTERVEICGGIPQGSCLSPILFNLYAASLPDLQDDKTHIFQYADDFLIVSADSSFPAAVNNLSMKANLFFDACADLNLYFNPSKTNTIYFAKGSKREIRLLIKGTQVNQVKSLRFLGRILNDSLTFRGHYEKAFKDCQSGCNIIKLMTNNQAGLPPKNALTVYKSLVRSKIEFGHSTCCNFPKYIEKRIQAFENRILKRCTGLTPSTSQHILNAISGEWPVSERALFCTAKELIKVKMINPSFFQEIISLSDTVTCSYTFCYQKLPHIFDKLDSIPPLNFITSKWKVFMNILEPISTSKQNVNFSCIRLLCQEKLLFYYNNGYDIYATDGSVGHNVSGFSVVKPLSETILRVKVEEELSSTFIELLAIRHAIMVAISDGIRRFVIFSDSRSALLLINKRDAENQYVFDIHKTLHESQVDDCHLVWVPGHYGFFLNVKADFHAGKARVHGTILSIKYTPNEAIRAIRNHILQQLVTSFLRRGIPSQSRIRCKKIFNK
ncbi:uncharacterized protein ACN2A1_013687 [Glossina fuscipes fuscipes]